ncbi:MAG: phosphotransferase [Actinomycetota bacterium]|nr:phosphotransferase [Actinomycetota bacterium]
MPQRGELVSAATVAEYLVQRGVIDSAADVEAVELGGGVSNVVLLVRAPALGCVVKQSLPRLRVDDEWLAKRERAINEANALRVANRLSPGLVPDVLDLDEIACALVIEAAPAAWREWKRVLLNGEAEPGTAKQLGAVLGTWHRETWDDDAIARRFDDMEAFDQLRIDPYYRTVVRRHPDLARPVLAYVDRMLSTRRCLVHGDYSPKNVLVGKGGLWVIDFEVAHFGDPVFDIAFMVNHLMLKGVHRPDSDERYRRCARAFWSAYREEVDDALAPPMRYLLGHVGCLMLARVAGKSPAEYLSESEQEVAWRVATALLLDPPDAVEGAWQVLRRFIRR